MIKIEITDPHLLDAKSLRETAAYLTSLAGAVAPSPTPVVVEEETSQVLPLSTPAFEPSCSPTFEPSCSPAKIFNPVDVLNLPQVHAQYEPLDVHGKPWDARIHTRTKSKTSDGAWKKMRHVGASVVNRVESQSTVPVPEPAAVVPEPVLAPAPMPPRAQGFTDLMGLVTKAITENKLRRDQVVEVLKPFGIPSLPLIATRLDLISPVMRALQEVIDAAL